MRYQNFSYKKCKCVFRGNSKQGNVLIICWKYLIGFFRSLRFLNRLSRNTGLNHEHLKWMRIVFIRKKETFFFCCNVFRQEN